MSLAIRFIILSGLGWCLDFGHFWVLVSYHWLPLVANLVTASLAAGFVYCVSRTLIFHQYGLYKNAGLGLSGYILYTVGMVCIFSLLIQSLVTTITIYWHAVSLSLDTVYLTFLVKIIVTPFNLAANFFVVRFLVSRIK